MQDLLKIGKTRGLDSINGRVATLQGANPYPLLLLGILTTFENAAMTEKGLHKRFAYCHIHGEWFEPASELVEYIVCHTKLPEDIEAENVV